MLGDGQMKVGWRSSLGLIGERLKVGQGREMVAGFFFFWTGEWEGLELKEESGVEGGDCNGGVLLSFLDCLHFLIMPMLAYSMISSIVSAEAGGCREMCLGGEFCVTDLLCFLDFFLTGDGVTFWRGDLASSRVCLLEFEWGEGGRGAGVLVSVVVMGVVGECG